MDFDSDYIFATQLQNDLNKKSPEKRHKLVLDDITNII